MIILIFSYFIKVQNIDKIQNYDTTFLKSVKYLENQSYFLSELNRIATNKEHINDFQALHLEINSLIKINEEYKFFLDSIKDNAELNKALTFTENFCLELKNIYQHDFSDFELFCYSSYFDDGFLYGITRIKNVMTILLDDMNAKLSNNSYNLSNNTEIVQLNNQQIIIMDFIMKKIDLHLDQTLSNLFKKSEEGVLYSLVFIASFIIISIMIYLFFLINIKMKFYSTANFIVFMPEEIIKTNQKEIDEIISNL